MKSGLSSWLMWWFALIFLWAFQCAYAQQARVQRPNIGQSRGGQNGVKSAAVRREEEEFGRRVKQKRRENPELFRPVQPLDPITTAYPPTKGQCGQTVLSDRVVTTAVIMTDEMMARYDLVNDLLKVNNETVITATTFVGGDVESKIEEKLQVIRKRVANARKVMSNLPVAYEEWPSVMAGECPEANYAHTASERGVGLAHSLIWKDWYYRHTAAAAAAAAAGTGKNKKTKSRCETIGAANGDSSGQRDLLVIFEDDLQPTVPYAALGPALVQELENMRAMDGDAALLFLGWCYGGLRSMPMCGHAYAINMNAAKLLVEQYNPCGISLDGQWHELSRLRLLKWKKAHHESYNGTAPVPLAAMMGSTTTSNRNSNGNGNEVEKEGESSYFRGMFKQGNLGTLNGHAFMPNANTHDIESNHASGSYSR